MGNWLDSNTAPRLPETKVCRCIWCGSMPKDSWWHQLPQDFHQEKPCRKHLVLWCWWWRFIKAWRTYRTRNRFLFSLFSGCYPQAGQETSWVLPRFLGTVAFQRSLHRSSAAITYRWHWFVKVLGSRFSSSCRMPTCLRKLRRSDWFHGTFELVSPKIRQQLRTTHGNQSKACRRKNWSLQPTKKSASQHHDWNCTSYLNLLICAPCLQKQRKAGKK